MAQHLDKKQNKFFTIDGPDINSRFGINCKVCKNTGSIYYYAENSYTPTARICTCQNVRRSMIRLEESGLSGVVKQLTFDNFNVTNELQKGIKETALEFLDTSGNWFYIGGQSGSGKTHICTAICGKLLFKKRKSLAYMQWLNEVKPLRGSVNENEEHSKLLDRYKNVDVLYIDDFFKHGKDKTGNVPLPTSAEIDIALDILNYRYINNLVTIISSERAIDDVLKIDEALGSRIVERCGNFIININSGEGNNYRLNRR